MKAGKERILASIAERQPQLQALGVQRIGLFGSFARGEEHAGSDVDILVEFSPRAHIGLFEFVRVRRFLADLLGCKVDLVTPDALRPEMREEILGEVVYAG